MEDGFRRRALIIAISHSLTPEEVAPGPDAAGLPFAIPAARGLADSLELFGYHCRVETDLPSEELGGVVREEIRTAGPDDFLIVAVLSTSAAGRSGRSLYAVGSDGRLSDSASVGSWVESVESFPDAPTTLFLIDMSMGGVAAASLPWLSAELRRAWVIAAAGPGEAAFDGRLTTATATVLQRYSAGELRVDPGYECIPIWAVAREIGREVDRPTAADGGYRQRVATSQMSLGAAGTSPPFFPSAVYRPGAAGGDEQDTTGGSGTGLSIATGGRVMAVALAGLGGTGPVALVADGHDVFQTSLDGFGEFRYLPGGRVYSLSVIPGLDGFLAGGADGIGREWVFGNTRSVKEFDDVGAQINQITAEGSGPLAAAASDDGTVHVWSIAGTRPHRVAVINAGSNFVNAVQFASDSTLLAAGADGTIAAFTLPGGERSWEARVASLPIHALAIAGRGGEARILAGQDDGLCTVCDLRSGRPVTRFGAHEGAVRSLSACGENLVASTGDDGMVRIWDARNGYAAPVREWEDDSAGRGWSVAAARLGGRLWVLSGHDRGARIRVLDDLPDEPAAGAGTPAVYYAGLLADVARGEDRLGVSAEVDTICNVIMARDIAPPLSIGLFGHWGTGKSFFMSLMRDRIARLAQGSERLRLEGTEPELCMDICQIEFNAWHYIDTNLWASLASRIFDQLAAAHGQPGLHQVMGDLPSMRAISRQLEEQRRQLQDRVGRLEAAVTKAEPVGIKDLTLAGISSARDQLPDGLPGEVGDLLEKAGVKKDQVTRLDEALPQVSSVTSLSLFLLRRGRLTVRLALAAALAVVIVGPSLAAGLLHPYIGSAAAWVSAWVGSLAAATLVAGPVLNRAGSMLRVVAGLVKNVEEDRQKSASAQQEGLRKRIVDIQGEIDDLDARIAAVREANSVQAFAMKRHGEDDYRREEGMLAVFRRDLEELSRKLTPSPAGGPAPHTDLERIVLYIDDLDRCPPARVVEVLQAIHLLLAFPLFVVVVGADPRWLLKSLQTHYRSILGADEGNDGADDPADDGHWAATPHNYLEKIIQIPFCLRPMSSDGYASLVTADIGRLAAGGAGPAPAVDPAGGSPGLTPAEPGTRPAAVSTVPPSARAATERVPARLVRSYRGDAAIRAVAFTPAAAVAQPVLTSLDADGLVVRRDVRRTGDATLTEGTFGSPGVPVQLTNDGDVAVAEVNSETAPGGPVARARIVDGATRQDLSAIDLRPAPDTVVTRLLLSPTGKSLAAIRAGHDGRPGGYWTTSAATRTALDAGDRREGEPLIVADSWHVGRQAGVLRWITDQESVPLLAEASSWFVTDPGQRRLVGVDSTGKIRMWQIAATVAEVQLPDGLAGGYHPPEVVCLGPGRLLAVASGTSARIWDVDAGRLHAEVETSEAVTALALSADDKRVAAGLGDGTVQCWLIAPPSHDDELATGVMQLTEAEAASILLMNGLIKTPRSARRLVNIYRLLRAGLTAGDLGRLQSADHGPVILLLAVLTGFPQLSADLLGRLMDESEQLPPTLAEFAKSGFAKSGFARSGEQGAAGDAGQPARATRRRFAESVTRVLATGKVSDDISVYRYWAAHVARFSFRTMDLL